MKLFSSQSTKEKSQVITRHSLIEFLFEHFDTGNSGFERCICDSDNFDIRSFFQGTTFNSASNDGSSSSDRKDIYKLAIARQ
jgi:hypothetical protein